MDPEDLDPYANDLGHWGASLATLSEIVIACLDAAAPRSIVEVGAYAGDNTRLLLSWAERTGASVTAIDPTPQEALVALAEERSDLALVREPSHRALADSDLPDAIVIDGDHNYYTVSEELRLVAEKAAGNPFPLLLLHDVRWPHARRDSYYTPEAIPEDYRQPMVQGAGLFPGEPGLRPGGLPLYWAAEREGGARNGVLTAVEDFLADHEEARFSAIPAFFGLGVIWHREAPWSDALASVVEAWNGHPLLERLEANRVLHLASSHYHLVQASAAREKNARQEAFLRELLKSKAFALAERISRVRQGGQPAFSKEDIRRILAD